LDIQTPTPTNDVSVLDASNNVLPSQVFSADSNTNTFRLLIQAKDIPSVGYKVLHVVPGKRRIKSDLKVSGMTMENAALRVSVDSRTGCMTSIYQKVSHLEALAAGGCGNQLQTFSDKPQGDDAWNIDPGTLDHFTPLMNTDSVVMIEKGPLRSVIRLTRTWSKSKIIQDILLYAGSDELEVSTDIDWHETNILLKAAFPLATRSKMATYEIPFGTIQRPTTRNNTWEQAKFEVPALQWADLGDNRTGLSLINESKYGYDCEGNVLRLTLLRSPVEPDPNADRGNRHFSYVLYPHAGDWKTALTIRRGYDYNNSLTAMQVQPHEGRMPLKHSFINLQASNVVMTAVKKAEGVNGLIIHFYEWQGKDANVRIRVPPGAQSAILTNLMEKPQGTGLSVTASGEITVPIHPFEIMSIRIRYPNHQN
ncbi:MAG: glycosyl hydrolase-related protein, partial [Acidobacteriota bacterium]|nr:glycosyl hydrolase-related protein [Acidobacteriota bacterium]